MIASTLSSKLPDDPNALIGSVLEAEAFYARVSFLLAHAQEYLETESLKALPPKGQESEFERKLIVASKVSPIKSLRDYLEKVESGIKQRVSLVQSLLRFYTETNEPRIISKTY